MAIVHGKGTDVQVDSPTCDALQDISAYCNNVDFPRDVNADEITTFGNDDRVYLTGLRGATISITGFWDATLDGILAPNLGAGERTVQYGPAGTGGGSIQYQAECILTNYTQTSPVDGPAGFSADFQITGAVTRGTY